ncbi:hypothetical protein GCM10007973_19550 [Polymorphobacter multimanifer]|nr:hypothetical protein GCM10007973_19550 [Polymorphobacter multimanifer]
MVTALATRAVARSVGGVSAGPVGMAIGVALPTIVRTLGPAGMIGLVVGGWAVKKVVEKRDRAAADRLMPVAPARPTLTPPPSPR